MINRELLGTLKDCYHRYYSYWRVFDCADNMHRIMVSKYEHTDFEISVISIDGKKIYDVYRNLMPFDCYNMIEELSECYS